MKIRNSLITLGAVAVAAIAVNFNASAALLSPRAAGNQIIHTAGINNDANLVTPGQTSAQFAAPHSAGNQVATTAGVDTTVNPATLCSRNMTASPKAIQACATSPTGAMPCCAAMAK